jgi:FKBP-type peptidyl-prolyl cis-trans isomerase
MKRHLFLLLILLPAFTWSQIRHEGRIEGGKKVAAHEWFNAQGQKIAEVNYGPAGEVIGFKTWDERGYLIDDEHLSPKREMAELPQLDLTYRDNGFGWLIVHGRADDHAPYARAGERVGIFYQGLLQDGTIFDQNYGEKKPLRFKLSMGEVIPGFDEAVSMLRVGEEGYFLIPADLAYKGQVAGIIPPFSDLLFRIKLVELN